MGPAPGRLKLMMVKLIPLDVDTRKTMRNMFGALGTHWKTLSPTQKGSGCPKQFRGWTVNFKNAGMFVRALAELHKDRIAARTVSDPFDPESPRT